MLTFKKFLLEIKIAKEKILGKSFILLYDTDSSWIAKIYYTETGGGKGFLIINMKGKYYVFKGFEKYNFEKLKKADSLGKFYHTYIKDRYYYKAYNTQAELIKHLQ